MVKGYDPSSSDPSKLLLEYIFRTVKRSNVLSTIDSERYVRWWLQNSPETSKIYSKFKNNPQKPLIVLKKYCYCFLPSYIAQYPDQNYPSYCEDNKIVLCLNYIRNKVQLKENLDRQLTILASKYNNKSTLLTEQENDINYLTTLYQSCKIGYKNYAFQQQIEQRLSKKCAKYLFRRRSSSQKPVDSLFRYTAKLADEIVPDLS